MASNARPLWSALPEGVLRRQVLTELAQLAQLDAHDLSDLWSKTAAQEAARHPGASASASHRHAAAPADEPPWGAPAEPGWQSPGGGYGSPQKPPFRKGSDWKGGSWKKKDATPWPPQPRLPRTPTASRADHAARLLLSHMAFLEDLTHDDHAALGRLIDARPRQGLAAEHDCTRRHPGQAEDGIDDGGLADAIAADQGQAFGRRHR